MSCEVVVGPIARALLAGVELDRLLNVENGVLRGQLRHVRNAEQLCGTEHNQCVGLLGYLYIL